MPVIASSNAKSRAPARASSASPSVHRHPDVGTCQPETSPGAVQADLPSVQPQPRHNHTQRPPVAVVRQHMRGDPDPRHDARADSFVRNTDTPMTAVNFSRKLAPVRKHATIWTVRHGVTEQARLHEEPPFGGYQLRPAADLRCAGFAVPD